MEKKIPAVNPATGEETAHVKAADDKQIKDAFKKSKKSLENWKDLSVGQRCKYLKRFRENVLEDLEDIVSTIKEDTGKSDIEILMSDILATLEITKYYEENAPDILKKEKRKTPFEFRKNYSYVEYEPYGTVSVISPWNYPFQLSVVPAITALIGGNTVVLKPSEITPLTGEKIKELFEKSGFPEGVFQVLQGTGEVGEKMIEEKPDKVFFTGGVETGKKVMEKASKQLIPVELELGGNDPFIVFKDADIDRAVKGLVYGALANSGQLCVSSERVYVERDVKKEFMEKLEKELEKVRVGGNSTYEMGPIIREKQIEKIKEHVEEAVLEGAEMLTDFERNGNFLKPVLLDKVDHDMNVMREETFGPVIPVTSFKGIEEAVGLANDTEYGLNASVWSEDIEKAEKVASKLETGNCYINDVVKNIGNPHLPFGGVKKSGIGRYHGPEGLKSFVQPKSVMVSGNTIDEINWFPYDKKLCKSIAKLIKTKYGKKGFLKKIKNYFSLRKEMLGRD